MDEVYKSDLRQRVEKGLDKYETNFHLLESLFAGSIKEGKLNPIDLRACVSMYRCLLEVQTAFKIYNAHFPEDLSEKSEETLEQAVNMMEKLLIDMLNKKHTHLF